MYLLGVLAVVFGILVSIALHEIGHLVPAKRFGVKVTQYMVGFRPDALVAPAWARPSTGSRASRSAGTSA